jgi:adenylate kinase
MDLVFFGIQGSGKGTQAKLAAEKYHLKIFEAGAELRKLSEKNSLVGRSIKKRINKGKLVPAFLIIKMVKNFLKNIPKSQAVIFDGIPRNKLQKNLFDRLMRKEGRTYKAVKFIVDKNKTYQRLLKRAQTEKRADDNEKAIKKRFKIFNKVTLPMINLYRKKGLVYNINGEQSIEDVKKETFQLLDQIL